MGNIYATHVVTSTYGTWPPGHPKGHWSPLFDLYGNLIERGHKLNAPDQVTFHVARERALGPEKVLTPDEQQIVADTIADVMRSLPDRIPIYAAAIERTHQHLLFGHIPGSISELVGRIKGRSSSAVIAHGREPGRTRTWVNGYWKVYVFDVTAIPDIQNYVEQHNVRRGLPRVRFPWVTPFV
ncbi:MAG TPA: transposase, partial [Tepidisphaeraceae bacterium]|nr:transposase [Tepidisphaeraceae bacterium]